MKLANRVCLGAIVALLSPIVAARGVSPYLPLDMSPAMERQIERVLILAGKPVMRRPIAAAIVLEALPQACERDPSTCQQVRRYLQHYMRRFGITSIQVQGAAATGDSSAAQPNGHGEPVDSAWRATASAYYQPNDYIIVNAGGVAYDGEAVPTGSYLSFGFDFAQLDIGYRDHWLSPLTDSSSLISTQAPTMPSITLSNWDPIGPLGITYEAFMAEMSKQDGILYQGATTSGEPRLAGLQLAVEPVRGYAIALSRVTQYGGGARGGSGFSDFTDALLTTSNKQDVTGETEATNRVASLSSTIQFPGQVPFAVSLEYAGEDNTYKGQYRLGATNMSLSLDLPLLWKSFDATFEASEWQNVWYIHSLYPLGLTHEGHVIGHWFGDNRNFGDAIGGNSQSLRAGWRLNSGDYVQATYRTMVLDVDWAGVGAQRSYERLQTLGVSYTTSWREHEVQAELTVGRDIFGESFTRIGAAFDLAQTGIRASAPQYDDADAATATQVFVDFGAQRSEIREIMLDMGPNVTTGPGTNVHFAVGARRPISTRNDLGVRLEFDRVEGVDLLSLRALDYRFRFNRKLAMGAFFGAARLDIGLPAYGYYWGAGLQYMDLFPKWDVGVDFRHHDKFTRDKVLSSDPPFTIQLPRRVLDVNGWSLYVSRRW